MYNGFQLYSNIDTKDTYFEMWGASTKHPDVMYRFSDFVKSDYVSDDAWNIAPWIFECASKLSFPCHSVEVAEFGMVCYEMLKNFQKSLDK